jgi:tryptophan synthase beta chain
VPPPVHAGGLRYHGMAPLISLLAKEGHMEARAVHQTGTFEAAIMFARSEGIISAPETSHAIRVTIDEALKCKESGESKTILFNHSGHGLMDLAAYERYLSNELQDFAFPEAEMQKALADLPQI